MTESLGFVFGIVMYVVLAAPVASLAVAVGFGVLFPQPQAAGGYAPHSGTTTGEKILFWVLVLLFTGGSFYALQSGALGEVGGGGYTQRDRPGS